MNAEITAMGGPITMGARRSMGTLVHERLRQAILDAQFLPGTVLSEMEIADHLEVSRTPVREAFQKLETEGLVQVMPQRGTLVARLDLRHIRDALFMRSAVEVAAFSRLPGRLQKVDLVELKSIVDQHARAAEHGNWRDVLRQDERFHLRLLEMADVPGVWRYVLEGRDAHRRVRILGQTMSDSAKRSAQEHMGVIEALEAGRYDAAAQLLGDHIQGNLPFAEFIAQSNPEFFTSITTSPSPLHIPANGA